MQLSRPYIAVLGVVAVLGAAWMFVLRPHNNSASTAASTPAAPGVTGLARDVAKARGAVATSQANAASLASKSAAASSASGAPASTAAAGGAPAPTTASKPVVVHLSKGSSPGTPTATPAATHPAAVSPSVQVASDLKLGKVVVILFWDPRAANDQAVMRQLGDVSRQGGKVVVMTAQPSQVASFGTVTTGVQVTETPTVLVINHQGQANVLTDLVDADTINQAVSDAQRGAGAVQTPTFSAWTPSSSRAAYIDRADNLCRAIDKSNKSDATLAQQITNFQAVTQLAISQINQVRAVPAPAADQVVLDRWFGLVDRSVNEIGGAVSAASAHQFPKARSLFFAAQTDLDRGGQGLANYGLAACFPQQSLTS